MFQAILSAFGRNSWQHNVISTPEHVMRHLICIVVVLVCAIVLAVSLWQRHQDSEVSVVEYGALYSLRRMKPELFREKLLPELEKAMTDGRLTRGELKVIETKVGSLGPAFLEAVKASSVDEQFSESLREMERKAKESGRNLGDSLGKALNDAMDYMMRKSDELSKKIPPLPQSGPEPPVKF